MIDMISHVRSFPSYNIVIGVFAWYCSQSVKRMVQHNELSSTSILNILSCFSMLTLFSLVLDGTFCFVWGREIIDGDVRSIKFSFGLFILNMIPKAVSTL